MSIIAMPTIDYSKYDTLINELRAKRQSLETNGISTNDQTLPNVLDKNGSIFNSINKLLKFGDAGLFGFTNPGNNGLPSINTAQYTSLTSADEEKIVAQTVAAAVQKALQIQMPSAAGKK